MDVASRYDHMTAEKLIHLTRFVEYDLQRKGSSLAFNNNVIPITQKKHRNNDQQQQHHCLESDRSSSSLSTMVSLLSTSSSSSTSSNANSNSSGNTNNKQHCANSSKTPTMSTLSPYQKPYQQQLQHHHESPLKSQANELINQPMPQAQVKQDPISPPKTKSLDDEELVKRFSKVIEKMFFSQSAQTRNPSTTATSSTTVMKSSPMSNFDKLFTGPRPSTYSLVKYIERIVQYLELWEEKSPVSRSTNMVDLHIHPSPGLRSLITSFIYLDRLSQSTIKYKIDQTTIHRLILVSMYIAFKFFEDHPISARFVAKVGGIPVHELNVLEIEFIKALNFNVYVNSKEFNMVYNRLLPLVKAITM